MSFWSFFAGSDEPNNNYGEIYSIITEQLPDLSHDECLKIACFAGLLARVAYADLNVDESEIKKIEQVLIEKLGLEQQKAQVIVNLTMSKTKELAGLENHIYCTHVVDFMDQHERLLFLVTLFHLAATDGSVDGVEVEEIRTIAGGLKLPHSDFVRAKAEVKESLSALKN